MIQNKKTTSFAFSVLLHSLLALAIIRAGLHFALPETEVTSGESVTFETFDKGGAKSVAPAVKKAAPVKATVTDDKSAVALPAPPKTASKSKTVVAKAEPKLIPVHDFEDVVPADKEAEEVEKKPETPLVAEAPNPPEAEPAPQPQASPEAPPAAEPEPVAENNQPTEVAAADGGTESSGEAPTAADPNGAGAVGSQSNPVDAEKLQEVHGNRAPSYPYISQLKREQGTVTLLAFITKDGHVDLPIVQESSGYPRLDQSAVNTYARWRYKSGSGSYALKKFRFRIK